MPRHRIGRAAMFVGVAFLTAACTAGTGTPSIDATYSALATTPDGSPTAPAAPPSAAASEGSSLEERTLAEIELGGGPDMPTEAFGSVWVVAVDGPLLGDGTVPAVHRIDPESNEVIASIEIPGRLCQGIGASPEAVWVCGPDGLVRIDPATNAIVAEVTFDAPLAVSRLAYGAGSVWAFATAAIGPDTVVRIDPATNAISDTIPLGHLAGTMAFGFEALWVTSPGDDVILRIDPATNAVEAWSDGIEGAGSLGVGTNALWVSLYGERGVQAPEDAPTVVAIDPESGAVTIEVDAGTSLGDSSGLVATESAVWVRGTNPFLVRIDPESGEIVDRLDANRSTGDVTVAFGSVWATSEIADVVRLEPAP